MLPSLPIITFGDVPMMVTEDIGCGWVYANRQTCEGDTWEIFWADTLEHSALWNTVLGFVQARYIKPLS